MTLKKSDKLIAIIGVIILIVAGIGIVLYAGNDNEKGVPPLEEEKQIKTFEVNYSEVSLSIDPDNTDYSIKPKLFGQSTYLGNIVLEEQNLKSLDIMVEYHDNFCGFLFGRILRSIGADALTIKVYNNKEEIAKGSIKGDGIVEFPSISIGSLIPVLTVEATDLNEAIAKLEEQYIDYNISYNIQITLKTGLWKKFLELLGKDNFDLTVNYTQFVYDIKNPEDDGGDINPPTGGYEYGTQTWATMSYPGKN
jgi:hypothetical protein